VTRASAGGTSREVAPVELFFDLVFVFAVSQLSQHLLSSPTWRGAAETVVLLGAVFGVWAYTSFETTVLGVDRRRAQPALLVVMFLGLVMNAAIGHSFEDGAWTFVVPLLACQFGYAALTMRTATAGAFREHFGRVLVWFGVTAPLWLVGGVVAPHARLWWWGGAALIDLAGTWLAHPLPRRAMHSDRLPFDAPHMVERLRLFLIIALGEAVLTTGAAVAKEPTRLPTVLTGLGCLAGVVALWAVFFGGSNTLVRAHLDETTDPVRSARLGLNGMYVVLAGLIALAVGNELVIAHPTEPGSWTTSLLMFGGPLLYLGAQNWYLARTTRRTSRWLWSACAALVVGGVLARVVPAWVSLAVLLAILGCAVAGAVHDSRKTAVPSGE
jgi:low temperature requirement protein LtrA